MPLHRRADPCPWPRHTIGEFVEEHLRNVVILVGAPAMEGDYQSPLPRVVAHRANIAGDNWCQMHTNTTLYCQTAVNLDLNYCEPYPNMATPSVIVEKHREPTASIAR